MAAVFDLRLRRWYHIFSPHVPPEDTDEDPDALWNDPYWFAVLRRTGHRARADFNEVEVTRSPVDSAESLVTRMNTDKPIGVLVYNLRRRPTIPACADPSMRVAPLHELSSRRYLAQSAELCSWEGAGPSDVVFKQVLHGWGESGRLYREIALLRYLELDVPTRPRPGASSRRHPFLPLIACVVDADELVRGFLCPYGGTPLDKLPQKSIKATMFVDVLHGLATLHNIPKWVVSERTRDPSVPVTEQQRAADEGMLQHGDLCARNVLLDEATGKVSLIDVGNSPYEYKGDRMALVEMMNALKEKPGASSEAEVKAMDEMEVMLRNGAPFEEIASLFESKLGRIPGTDSNETSRRQAS
ncbi:hypothetical protein DENSPDRAFT_867998 [Dentipellis sp. KUC8613]|nr:hypothetical protein DENSPDRAFT_867998 [Dentipellis sp. KUC8613]